MEPMLVVASHPELDHHDSGAGHPERHGRLEAAVEGLRALDLGDDIDWLPPRAATIEELSMVHDLGYLDALADLCAAGGGHLDPDTAALPQAVARLLYVAQEARILFKLIVEQVILGRESD